ELLQEALRLLPGIHDHGVPAPRVRDEVAVLDELAVGDPDDLGGRHGQSRAARRSARYFSTPIAAVVASPTAVVIWRVSWSRRSPAANRPGIEVIMRSSVMA